MYQEAVSGAGSGRHHIMQTLTCRQNRKGGRHNDSGISQWGRWAGGYHNKLWRAGCGTRIPYKARHYQLGGLRCGSRTPSQSICYPRWECEREAPFNARQQLVMFRCPSPLEEERWGTTMTEASTSRSDGGRVGSHRPAGRMMGSTTVSHLSDIMEEGAGGLWLCHTLGFNQKGGDGFRMEGRSEPDICQREGLG